MTKLICPKCHRTVETVAVNPEATCLHGRPSGRMNPPVPMVPIEKVGTS